MKYFCVLFNLIFLLNISTPAQKKSSTPTNWPEPVFEHLTIANGLPESTIRCILQDHLGYMWFGTQNGLVRYDGYNMKVYQPDPKDSLSISDRQIYALYEDKSGTLWVGTEKGGLNHFDRKTETFTKYEIDSHDSASIDISFVLSIYEDKTGNLLFGTESGLFLVNRQTESFRHIGEMFKYENIKSINHFYRAIIASRLTGNLYVSMGNKILVYDAKNEFLILNKINAGSEDNLGVIRSFYQDVDGTIWIGHRKGLAKFNSFKNTIVNYQPVPSIQYNVENDFGSVIEDKDGFIWCAGIWNRGNLPGLVCFNTRNEQFKSYKSDPDKQSSLSTNIVWSVYKDRSGVLWVGTGWGGLNKWDKNKYKFKRFSSDAHNPNSEPFNSVYTIIEDREGTIWFGTDNGLNSYNRFTNKFKNYKYNSVDKDNSVLHISKDESGVIWFGTTTKGLGKFDISSSSFHFYSNIRNDSTSISNNQVPFILQDNNDVLWVGTWGGGLNKFNKKTGKFTRLKLFPFSENQITSIYNDRKGELWIGTDDDGLNELNRADETLKSFDLGGAPSATSITTIYEDKKGNFWVGTYQSGIHLFDRSQKLSVYNITEKDGLANNYIRSILEDKSGTLWIGTERGLSRFDPATNNIKNYFTQDGFEGNRYNYNGSMTSTGDMLFGTDDGFIIFNPDSIKDDPTPPQIVISNVSLFNKPRRKLKFDGFISELKELDLSYDENDLRFDYVGLHFGDPQKNKYKYQLEGFDKDWVDAGTQRNATYTNLDAGEYVFKVTACNCDGVWNEEGASLKIIIPPPFWATWWVYAFYFIVLGSILYGIRKYEMNRQLWKHRLELETVEAVKYKEINRMKSHFFANISHEFRTPLTLILGPSENILTEAPSENTIKQAGAIKRNANRLLGLINQLLDLSKLEAGKVELKALKSNIVSFVKGITMSFESIAERKDITLKVKSSSDEIELYFDKEKMTKIMSNLLMNAFKFTPEGGEIIVSISKSHSELVSESSEIASFKNQMLKQASLSARQVQHDNCVEIKVKDTGIGIPEEELPKLFDRFYQVDSSQTREHEGTGIGLALTKELVELHHGAISVESKLGDWTEFKIELPTGKAHLTDDEIVEEPVILTPLEREKNLSEQFVYDMIKEDSSSQTPQNDNELDEGRYIILVVEDNTDVREFIKDSLGNAFQIEEAANGEQGVRKAEQIIPDLIISDVMMPKMDGNELTRILKNDEKTSHIPIILLTAKSEQESKLEGLKTGADDYLTKPFDTKELQIRINNLINIRRKLQQKFSRADVIPLKKEAEKKLSNLEELFMSKVMAVIENHLSEEEFSIEQFGKEVGMSRVQLHRKLKVLSGKSASNYLRSVRLNKAKKMIEEEKGNISEIAYSVGFSSPQYFTRCFKEEFGFSPSDLKV